MFGKRLHPTWINKFATPPPLYGHHTSEFGAEPLLPVLSDLGVMAKASIERGPWALTLNGYVTRFIHATSKERSMVREPCSRNT